MISIITFISIAGVAVGVMALVIALAINTGFRNTLQENLLRATPHVSIVQKEPGTGIENWRELIPKLARLPHVVRVSPGLYEPVYFSAGPQGSGGILKGIPSGRDQAAADVLNHLKEGSAGQLEDAGGFPGIILGAALAQKIGGILNSVITVTSPQGEMTPFGTRPAYFKFRVVGIYQTGFFDLDSAWAFTSLAAAQKVFALRDVVNSVEIKLDDPNRAPAIAVSAEKLIGDKLAALTWIEQNRQLRNALKAEKVVTVITIGLIQLVGALNILITLVMMTMEKHRDIAVLMSMGAKREQIRRIFMAQGLLIGVVGTIIGLILGYTLSLLAGRYRWITLDSEVYSLSYVPFDPQWMDGLWIAATAILVSFVATIYPAHSATRIAPAEALRYE